MQNRRKTGEGAMDAVVIDADGEEAMVVDSEDVPNATEAVHVVRNPAVY